MADGSTTARTSAYTSSLQHVLAELARLDLLLSLQVGRVRHEHTDLHPDDGQGLSGLYIADAEVDALLDRAAGAPLPPELSEPVEARLDELAVEIAERTVAGMQDEVYLRLVVLAHLFGLAPFDMGVVVVCLAPEIDRRYERVYAYLHDDVTRRSPTVDLVLGLLCPDLETRVAARTRFGPSAPLLRHRLVHLADDAGQRSPSLLGKVLQLDPRVARFLLDDDDVDERLRGVALLVTPTVDLDDLVFPAAFAKQLQGLTEHATGDGDGLVLYLQGPYGVGKQAVAEACCRALGANLLVVHGRRLVDRPVAELEEIVQLVDREARLQGAMLHWDGFDALLADDRQAHLAAVLAVLEAHPGPTFLTGSATWEPRDALHGVSFVRLELPHPGHDERRQLWQAALGADGAGAAQGPGALDADVDLVALATTFRLSGGQIADAAATARNLARSGGPSARITQDHLHAACRLQSNRTLGELAQKVTPRHSWDDLVLPADHMEQLREVHSHVRHRALVHDTWGFDRKLATGNGLNVLFAGPPGTGKTMAADVLAHELGLDLYKIDLSNMLSKYIGETEKNLARLFDEATTSNAILFFDEADALFGKRTQVRDAHDRYANVEISYLLQRMDDYEGVVVLATNLRKNMDEAFVRRLHFTLEFPMPGLDDRRRLWAQIWPSPAPLDPGLDLDLLAREVEVSGGAIRNIALAGAFLAAADGGVVTMPHLVHATQREYQKMGKVLTSRRLGSAL